MNYTELKAAVKSELHRTDLDAKIPGFIDRAEAYLRRELSSSLLAEAEVSGSTTAGGVVVLPADFGDVSELKISHGGRSIALNFMHISDGSADHDSVPRFYTIEGGNLRIYGADASQAYSLVYKKSIPSLSDSQPTNWLLEIAQDLYLFASTLEAARHVRNQLLIESMTAATLSALDSVQRFIKKRGQPSKGGLQIRLSNG
jgi:hypothetical protein